MPSDSQTISHLGETIGADAEAMLLTPIVRKLLNGAVVGILRDGQSCLCTIGSGVTTDSRFEIGSITKTYTAELLDVLVRRGTVRLDDSVASFLPAGPKQATHERPITLFDLATHRSGLTRLPFSPQIYFSPNPYARFSTARLEKYLMRTRLQRPAIPEFRYSNLGYAVLGYCLSRAVGISYKDLLQREILKPQSLPSTALAMSGQLAPEIVQGHRKFGRPAARWTFDAFAPAGALCSTAGDQLKWIQSLLSNPDRAALQPHAKAGDGQIGLAWMIRPGGESCWHNGGTYGFSSYVGLHRKMKYGVVVLANRYNSLLVTKLGSNLERLLRGLPALPL
jgi:CubicO group peptidase (beta-lactamase class C family)